MMHNDMFGGWRKMPVQLYWCTLNQQIVERHPERMIVPSYGPTLYGTGYSNIRKSMTYIGDL